MRPLSRFTKQYLVLRSVGARPGLRAYEYAHWLRLDSQAVTNALDPLLDKGLVEHDSSPSKWAWRWALTEKGEEMLREISVKIAEDEKKARKKRLKGRA